MNESETNLADDMVEELEANWPSESPIADQLIKPSDPATVEEGASDGTKTPSILDFTSTPQLTADAEVFDPEIHAVDEAGNPRRNKDGSLSRKRGRGGVKKQVDLTAHKAMVAATATVETIFIMGQMIGGEEWQPIVDTKSGVNERQSLLAAWSAYYMTKPDAEIPPWLGVAIATGAYALPRFTMPKTQTRMERLSGWIKSRVMLPLYLKVKTWKR